MHKVINESKNTRDDLDIRTHSIIADALREIEETHGVQDIEINYSVYNFKGTITDIVILFPRSENSRAIWSTLICNYGYGDRIDEKNRYLKANWRDKRVWMHLAY